MHILGASTHDVWSVSSRKLDHVISAAKELGSTRSGSNGVKHSFGYPVWILPSHLIQTGHTNAFDIPFIPCVYFGIVPCEVRESYFAEPLIMIIYCTSTKSLSVWRMTVCILHWLFLQSISVLSRNLKVWSWMLFILYCLHGGVAPFVAKFQRHIIMPSEHLLGN